MVKDLQFSDYKARLDSFIRPQDDFFEFVNHKWLTKHPIPDSETRWGVINVLRDEAWQQMYDLYEDLTSQDDLIEDSIERQARDFYYTGMHMDALEDTHTRLLMDYLGRIDAVADLNELSGLFGELEAIGAHGLWYSSVGVDNQDSERHILRLRQPSLTLPNRDYYLEDDEKMRQIRKEYKKHTRKVYDYFPELASTADELWRVLWDIEHEAAKALSTPAELRDIENNYNRRSFPSLSVDLPAIDWQVYAVALGWKHPAELSVDQPHFFAFLNQLLSTKPLNDLKIYTKWRLITSYYGAISEHFATLKFEFFGNVLSGAKEVTPLWKRVVLNVDSALGEGVGRLYAERHFPESSKRQVLEMVEDLRSAYAERIQQVDWMSEPTKLVALEKLANTQVLIGYPDTFRDYSSLKVGRTSYIANKMAAARFENDYYLDKLEKPTSRDEWMMYPQMVNAYNDQRRLVICFPAAILQKPFFDPDAHIAVNMGGIGMVIGHELTHGFDDKGCCFDALGNARIWWSDAERLAFEKRIEVIVKQADAFEVLPSVYMRGELVIGESIADLGGLEIAYHALRTKLGDSLQKTAVDGLTASELFFINYAIAECAHTREERTREVTLSDPHPSETFRVNAILQHVQGFNDTFKVIQGDELYRSPGERANIW